MNTRHFIFALLVLLLLASCQNVEKTAKPENLIPENEMVDILVDFAQIDALISLSTKEYEKRGAPARRLIFEKYNIDSIQLVQSSNYYADHFKINQRIYEAVEAKLQKATDSLNALDEKYKKEVSEKARKEREEKNQQLE